MLFLLNNNWLIILVLTPLIFFALAWILRAFQHERAEADAGLDLLCSMRWRAYCQLITEVLRERGMEPAETSRSPGADGYDLLFVRGGGRYLVQCRNARRQKISAEAIEHLHKLTRMQSADGAMIVSCASAEPSALKLAKEFNIPVLAHRELWQRTRPWVPHDQRTDVQNAAVRFQRRQLLTAGLGALGLALLLGLALMLFGPDPVPAKPSVPTTPAAAQNRTESTATSPAAAASAAMQEAAPEQPITPPEEMTEKQRNERRAQVLADVRDMSQVQTAIWATQSTLQVQFDRTPIDDSQLAEKVSLICSSVLRFEELRFTRLQVEHFQSDQDSAPAVRWRQCR